MSDNSHHPVSGMAIAEHGGTEHRINPEPGVLQVIDLFAAWCLGRPCETAPAPPCRLGCEPARRRGGACSACTVRRKLEIDMEVERLIDAGAFKRRGLCPYRVVDRYLFVALTTGPDLFRARRPDKVRVDPVVEIKGARNRIAPILASSLCPEDIEAITATGNDASWKARHDVLLADQHLKKALDSFTSQPPTSSRRGRPVDLRTQAIARGMARAWQRLTGRLPAKDNSKFHSLLLAAMATIFGHPAKEPNLEWATKTAVKRIKKDAASRRKSPAGFGALPPGASAMTSLYG